MRVLILCAGEGTRLRPLTHKIAKPAIPVLNIPMWAYPLSLIEALSPTELHVNLHYLPESIKESFKRHAALTYPLHFHYEHELLGSAGPLMHLKKSFRDDRQDVLLANGDGLVISKNPSLLPHLQEVHRQSGALATILAMPMDGAGSQFSGVWTDKKGQLLGIGTQSPASGAQALHYASIILLSHRIYDFVTDKSRNIFTDVLIPAGDSGEVVQIFSSNDILFFETGNLGGLLKAHQELLKIIRDNQSEWNLIDVFDRFQPGWRNYQKKFLYRNKLYNDLTLKNPSEFLTMMAGNCLLPSSHQKVLINGPSTAYAMKDYPEIFDGIYWGHLKTALLNNGSLIDL